MRKIWGGFSTRIINMSVVFFKTILAKIINMAIKMVIFKLKNIDVSAKFG